MAAVTCKMSALLSLRGRSARKIILYDFYRRGAGATLGIYLLLTNLVIICMVHSRQLEADIFAAKVFIRHI
jgi:hypothetical protein